MKGSHQSNGMRKVWNRRNIMFQIDPMKSGLGRPTKQVETSVFFSMVVPTFPLGTTGGYEFRTGVTRKLGPMRMFQVVQANFDQMYLAGVVRDFLC